MQARHRGFLAVLTASFAGVSLPRALQEEENPRRGRCAGGFGKQCLIPPDYNAMGTAAGGWARPARPARAHPSARRRSWARISRRSSLPTLDLGSMSRNSMYWGTL